MCTQVLKEIGVTDCGISNNHFFDYGVQGMSDIRLYGVIGRIETTIRKLLEFVDDTAMVIQELEEERLLFGPANVQEGKSLVSSLRYSFISTPALTAR